MVVALASKSADQIKYERDEGDLGRREKKCHQSISRPSRLCNWHRKCAGFLISWKVWWRCFCNSLFCLLMFLCLANVLMELGMGQHVRMSSLLIFETIHPRWKAGIAQFIGPTLIEKSYATFCLLQLFISVAKSLIMEKCPELWDLFWFGEWRHDGVSDLGQ